MVYDRVEEGVFLLRKNRFIAEAAVGGLAQSVHVKNTGRLREILLPGSAVYLQRTLNPERKTLYDLIAVRQGDRVVNVDSLAANGAAEEWIRGGGLFPDLTLLRREVPRYGSRFDLYAEHGGSKAFIEVKGVTLDVDGVARFPDAPTERGIKHLRELARCREEGFEAYLLFVAQMGGVRRLEPNRAIHPAFADALAEAARRGVRVLAYDCRVTPDSIALNEPVPVRLEP